MTCQHYLINKQRYCKNKALKGSKVCHTHTKKTGSAKHQKRSSQVGGATNSRQEIPYISPYALTASKLPVNSVQELNAPWYHYQAPTYQTVGDYVCIKKSYLADTRNLLTDLWATDR
jgi:hypothetical protein